MTDTARRLLIACGACPESKIRVVPHGAPSRLIADSATPTTSRHYARRDDRFLLSTFGLISPGKGIEVVIEALPSIIEHHPDLVYVIAGSHPSGRRASRGRALPGDARAPRARARTRRPCRVRCSFPLDRQSRWIAGRHRCLRDAVSQPGADRFRRADVRARLRLCGGLDALLVCARHARFRAQDHSSLSTIRQRLPKQSAGMPMEPEELAAARAEARRVGSSLAWPSVAKDTASVLREARGLAPRRRPSGVAELQLTTLRTDHLLTLVDDVGIIQHAYGTIPNRDTGYCVDDVARLALVALALAPRGDEQAWTSILYRALGVPPCGRGSWRDAQLHGL